MPKIPIPSLFAERNEEREGGRGLSEDERCPKTRNESLPRLRGIHPFFADIFSRYQARNNKVHINKKAEKTAFPAGESRSNFFRPPLLAPSPFLFGFWGWERGREEGPLCLPSLLAKESASSKPPLKGGKKEESRKEGRGTLG